LKLNGAGSMDRVHPLPSGWVSLSGPGTGTVDGIPYMRKFVAVDSPASRWGLGHGFDIPDGSTLRLTFTNLYPSGGSYYAGTEMFAAYRFGTDPSLPPPKGTNTRAKGWILVEDVSDLVRMVLIWAGFQEFHVEDVGWSLFSAYYFGADKFHIDVINYVLQQGDFIFYMGPPTNDDRSIGVPHFEYMSALKASNSTALEVRDTDMTEAMQIKWDLSTLPEVMRYRGAMTQKGGGTLLGFGIVGLDRRFQATYYPPWSHSFPNARGSFPAPIVNGQKAGGIFYRSPEVAVRNGSILRQFTETMGDTVQTMLQSNAECLMACVLAAVQYALNMATTQFQIPGIAPINLNDQIGIVDEAAAINSRVWVADVESEHVTGGGSSDGYWRMTVAGALIDTPDMAYIRSDYNYAWSRAQPFKMADAAGMTK